MNKDTLLRAALAGLSVGLTASAASLAQDKPGDVKCYWINGCGSHAKCGSGSQILNWVPTAASECKTQSGILIEEGKDKKKVAKKA